MIDEFDPANVATAYTRAQLVSKVHGEQSFTATGEPIGWKPQMGGQELFLSSFQFEVLLEGNRGGGKTEVLLADFCQHCGEASPSHPQAGYGRYWRGILFRKSFPDLADIIEKSYRVIPRLFPGAVFNQQNHTWTFPTGETLRFAFAEREQDYWKYHGSEYPWVGWEELTTWATDKLYLRMMSVCRSAMPGMPRKYRATTNPYGPGHGWVKARWRLPMFRDSEISGETDEFGEVLPTRASINVKLEDNMVLLRADPEYVSKLRALADDPAMLKAWLQGSWTITSGGMFDDVFTYKVHVWPDFTPPPSWTMDRAYDDGSSAPFAVGWWAVSDGSDVIINGVAWPTVRGDLFLVREWYGMKPNTEGKNEGLKLSATEITAGIRQRELEWKFYGRVNTGPADSAIFARNHGVCIADDMRQPVRLDGKTYPGIIWAEADKRAGTRVAGWKQIRALMKQAIPDPKTKRREKPGIFICVGNKQWLRTVPTLPRDEKNRDDVEAPEDHAGDMTRYRVHNPPRVVKHTANNGF